jgi:hypothetical protein
MVALTESLLTTLGDGPVVEATTTANNLNRSWTKLGSRAPDSEGRDDRKEGEVLRFTSPVPAARPAAVFPEEGMPGMPTPQSGQGKEVQHIRNFREMALANKVSRSFAGVRSKAPLLHDADSYLQVDVLFSPTDVC